MSDSTLFAEIAREIAKHVVAELRQTTPATASKYITTADAIVKYSMGPAALANRKIRRVKKGRAWAWLVDDIEACLANGTKPAQPRAKRPKLTGVNEDAVDQMLARGELRKAGAR